MKKIYLYPAGQVPGNIEQNDLSYFTYNTQNIENNYNYSNLKQYYQINIPYIEYHQSEYASDKAVIILAGGGAIWNSYDPETSEAVDYWKQKKSVSIFVLFYRTPVFQNNLQNFLYSLDEIYNLNAISFIMFYDLHQAINIVKTNFSKKTIVLHGFSNGGFVSLSYVSIACFNKNLLNDICKVVNTCSNYVNQVSPEFQELINKYKRNYYVFENNASPIKAQVLHYPITDQTIPQEKSSFSVNSIFSKFLNSFYPESVYALTLLFSNKLFSDGVSDPVSFEAQYSLIQENYPPIYLVHTLSDPLLQNTFANLLYKWLNEKNISNVKQSFSFGGHGFGMGCAFSDTNTYPSNQYPNNFQNKFYEQYNTFYGSDSVNNNYQSENSTLWFQSPFIKSNMSISLNEFLQTFFLNC